METELTKKIKVACHGFKPEMATKFRTIRYADEVWTPTGIVDVIRFEDYIEKNNSYCAKISPSDRDLKEYVRADQLDGVCKVPGGSYGDRCCRGCIYQRHRYELGMLVVCYEVKISVSDFKSENGHNFHGNKNYYVVDSRIYNDIKGLVPDDIGIIAFYEDSGSMRLKKECVWKDVSYEIKTMLLYNALKKWCDASEAKLRSDENSPLLR